MQPDTTAGEDARATRVPPAVVSARGWRNPAWRVVLPYLLVVGLLALMGAASVDILSSVRAYVGGESMWSKGQKDAFAALRAYVHSGDEAEYRRFEAALAVPLGYRTMRVELDKPAPDYAAAFAGYTQGGSHVDDWPGVVRLFRVFRRADFMSEVIDLWAEVDVEIVHLRAFADELQAAGTSRLDAASRLALLQRIDTLDTTLTAKELRFSARLGEASRHTRTLLMSVMLTLAAALAAMGALFAHRMLNRLAASQRSLRESNARWDFAAAAANIGVFDWDVGREQVLLDSRALALFGIVSPQPRWLSLTLLREMSHADDLERVSGVLRHPPESLGLIDQRFRIVRADGDTRHLEMCGRRSVSGAQVVGVLWDVTDEVLSEQLRSEKQAAETANRAKSEFLSRVSHELRTPLNAVLGFAQMMSVDSRHPLDEVQRRRLQHVTNGGQYLLKLVNDMLDLSAIEHGSFGVTIDDVDLADVLAATTGLLEPMRAERGVDIECSLQPGVALVRADRTRLEQVFVNLLSNALKYNRPGGRVVVEAQAGGADVVVTVRDSGIGMTPEQVIKLFQPFNRVGAEFSGVEGAGLGLVVCRMLVARFGGSITVNSERDVGTSVEVRLPLAEVQVTA